MATISVMTTKTMISGMKTSGRVLINSILFLGYIK